MYIYILTSLYALPFITKHEIGKSVYHETGKWIHRPNMNRIHSYEGKCPLFYISFTLKNMNYIFHRLSRHNLRQATIVYRLIAAALIGNFMRWSLLYLKWKFWHWVAYMIAKAFKNNNSINCDWSILAFSLSFILRSSKEGSIGKEGSRTTGQY